MTSRDPASEQFSRVVTAFTFVILLMGQYSWERLDPSLTSIPEPRILVIIVSAIPILAWANTFRRGSLSLRPASTYLCLLLSWILWMFLSTAWTPFGTKSGPNNLDLTLLFAIITIGLLGFAAHPESALRLLLWMTFATGLVYAILGLAAAGTLARIAVLGGGPNVYGRVTALGVIASLALVISGQASAWLLSGTALMIAATILSGSRGAMFSLFAGLVLLLPLALRNSRRTLGVVITLAALSGIVYAAFGNAIYQVIQDRVIILTLQQGYDSGRTNLQAIAWDMFHSRPITGWGIGSYGQIQGIADNYPHNFGIQTLAEAGTIGFCLMTAAILVALLPLARQSVASWESSCLLAMSGLVLVASLYSGGYYDTRLMWYFLGAGCFFAGPRPRRSHSVEPVSLPAINLPRSRLRPLITDVDPISDHNADSSTARLSTQSEQP